jgi:hypothetical protein
MNKKAIRGKNKIKKGLSLFFTMLSIVIVLAACFGFSLLIDKMKLSNLFRVEAETGLSLPPGVRIVSTSMHRFSLVDGRNYEWLIQSDRDITDWVEANMRLEGGSKLKSRGWGDITAFGQVASLAQGDTAQLALDSVWISVRQVKNGKMETAYLFLAKGGKVAQLSTFRP